MALSGTLSTSVCGGHYVLRGDWTATQNVANNKSTVTVTLYLVNDWGLDIGSRTGTITINGTAKSITSSAISSKGTHTLGSATVDVPHNSDGTKTFTIAISWNMQATISGYGYQGTLSTSKSFTLDAIARYATSVQSLKSKTETSITMNWSSDSTINYIWYSTNGGTSWTAVGSVNAKSGSYTISGLSANTAYSIKTRVQRSDSSLKTDSSALSVTTYQYPYVSAVGTSNLTIGNNQVLTLYNPLGRSCTVSMRYSTVSGTLLASGTTSVTSITLKPSAATLYAAIPSAKSGTAIYFCEYNSHRVSTKSGTFTINTSACTPTMGDPTYADTNGTTIGYTGSNQKIIQSQSIVRFTVGSVSTKNNATVSSVKVTVNGQTYTMSASGSTYTGGNAAINASSNVSATVTVTDSRGLTASKSVTVSMLAWSAPTGTVTLSRHLGYYAQTTLKCVTKFSSWSGVTTNNSITISYRAKATGQTDKTGTLTSGVATTLNCDENYSWTFTITITDLFTTTTITKILGKGSPTMFINTEKQSVGVGLFPTGSKSLEVISTDGSSNHNVAEELEFHNKEITGWINGLPTRNIDEFPLHDIYGTYWCNLYDTGITGTLPTTRSGQGLLICKKQQSTLYRQIYIGISGAPVRKFRYYTISTGVWTEWEDWSSEIETVSFTPASGVNNGLFIHKSGRIVTINGYCSGVTFSGANVSTVLGTLSDYYPPYTIRALCAIGANAYSVGTLGYVALDANGSLYARSPSALSNRAVYFSIAYTWTERS